MSVMVQQRISPPIEQNVPNFSDALSAEADIASDSAGKPSKTSFRDLVGESMNRIKEEREAKKNNDFSGAKTDAEFLEKLAETGKPQKPPKNDLDKDDFLKLFVAQLQHQDPLNPDDGAEMASKLAQFNGVEQMINMNTGLKKLLEAQNGTKAMSMVQYIGKEASVDGGRVIIKDGRFDKPSFTVPRDAPDATLQVFSPQGVMVAEQPVGFLKKGNQVLNWNGLGTNGEKVGDGAYQFKIAAKDADGAMAALDIKTTATITGVDLADQENSLNTTLGKMKLADIKSIGVPQVDAKTFEPPSIIDRDAARTLPQKMGEVGQSAQAQEKSLTLPPDNKVIKKLGQDEIPREIKAASATNPGSPATKKLEEPLSPSFSKNELKNITSTPKSDFLSMNAK